MGPPTGFADAFEKLRRTVTDKDAQNFQSTTLQDVWTAAREIESVQRERQLIRNMRRIEPFLHMLEKYSKTIEVICNGTPYLPWVWAPIKLMLQLANEHTNVFEKLLVAYSKIAEALPRFERFEKAFSQNIEFQNVMATVYAEILEFHRLAYKFFRRRAWHIIFDSLWKDFDRRFSGILESLARHRDLVDKEALSIDIVEARKWRLQTQEDIELRGNETRLTQLQHSTAWLAVEDVMQDDDLDKFSRRRQPGTCDWILKNPRIASWIADTNDYPILWLKGIPGAGKSVLSSYIIGSLLRQQKTTVAYYFCNGHNSKLEQCGAVMRTIALQILRENEDLAAHVSDKYANHGGNPSIQQLRKLIPELLANTRATRIVIDGLDEYLEKDQKAVLQELLPLCSPSDAHCKLLISSREGAYISKTLGRKPYISLRDRTSDVNTDIGYFVSQNLGELRERFDCDVLDNIEQRIVEKAGGMFLWVRLVITTLEDQYSLQDLEDAVNRLPNGLNEAYGRILTHLTKDLSPSSREKAVGLLQWVACSYRLLKVHEILDGIVFEGSTSLSERTKLNRNILDLCKPLIEEGPGDTIEFVHFSAREYILHSDSGPFLCKGIAHQNMAFSCSTYLASSLCFIQPTVTEHEIRLRVIKGYHGLHHYAQEYWLEHLLQFARLHKTPISSPQKDLIGRIKVLLQFEKKNPMPEFTAELSRVDVAPSISTDLSMFDSEPEIRKLLDKVLVFRDFRTREKQVQRTLEELMSHELMTDPTYFSEIAQRYQNIVELLLNANSANSLTGEEQSLIDDFRKTYRDMFKCRYQSCQRHVSGFVSKRERDEHEILHLKTFKCMDHMCEFYNSGFRTKSALQKHNSKYHASKVDVEIPTFRQTIPLRPKFVPAVVFIPDITSLLKEARINTVANVEQLSKLSAGPHMIGPDEIRNIPCLDEPDKPKFELAVSSLWNIANARPQHKDHRASVIALDTITKKLRLETRTAKKDIAETDSFRAPMRLPPSFPSETRKDWEVLYNSRVLCVLDIDEISKTDQLKSLTDMAISPDGNYVAVCSVFTEIYDTLTGALIKRTNSKDANTQMPHADRTAFMTPAGKRQPKLKKQKSSIDYTSRKSRRNKGYTNELEQHSQPSTSACDNGRPSVKRRKSLDDYTFQGHYSEAEDAGREESAKCASFAPYDHILATGSWDGSLWCVRIWTSRDSRLLQTRLLHSAVVGLEEINDLEWAKEEMKLACCAGCDVYVWSYTAENLTTNQVFNCQKVLLRVALSADAKYVAAGDDSPRSGLVYLWNVKSGQLISQLACGKISGEICGLSFAPTKYYTLCGSWNRFIRMWDLEIHKGLMNKSNESTLYNDLQPLSDISFTSCAFTPDGRWLISTCASGSIQFWSLKGEGGDAELEISILPTPSTNTYRGSEAVLPAITVPAVSPRIVCSAVRGIFATSGSDGVVRLWVYKHHSPGSTNVAVHASLIDGCDRQRSRSFDQILADDDQTGNDDFTSRILAPLERRHIIKKLTENEKLIFFSKEYWKVFFHIVKDDELIKEFITNHTLLTQQFLSNRHSFRDQFTISTGTLDMAILKITQFFLIISDAIEKHRVKIELVDIDLSIVNKLVSRDVLSISFQDDYGEIPYMDSPGDLAGPSVLMSSDDESAMEHPDRPNQQSLPDVEVVEIESDEDAAHSEEINELSQEYIMISSDEDLMELDNNGARPLKRKRRVH